MARIFIDVEPTHSDGVRMWSVRVQGEAVRPKYPKKAEALAQGRKRGREEEARAGGTSSGARNRHAPGPGRPRRERSPRDPA